MKNLAILISIVLLTINSYCQTGKYKPFKMVIITPDTALIDSSLQGYIDTIQQNHLKSYYNSIKQMEEMIAFKDFPEEMKAQYEEFQARTKANLDSARFYEDEVKKFKYFEIISEYSTSVFQFYFNEYPPFSTFQLVQTHPITPLLLKNISDSLNADYVVCYKNIYTENLSGTINLKLTTLLYSKQENQILLEKETLGETNSNGDMWTCMNPLSCLFINGVSSSTEIVFEILYKRQKME